MLCDRLRERACTSSSATARSSAATRSSSRRARQPALLRRTTRAPSSVHALAQAARRWRWATSNAGTIEFLARPGDGSPSTFLEMNTRLQVEHPVSELAHRCRHRAQKQIAQVAAGGPAGAVTQDDIALRAGTRSSAASTPRTLRTDFRPTPGTLTSFELRVRYGRRSGHACAIDTHLDRGRQRSRRFYDSLLAKLIVARRDARRRPSRPCEAALSAASHRGRRKPPSRVHQAVLASPEFQRGDFDMSTHPRLAYLNRSWPRPVTHARRRSDPVAKPPSPRCTIGAPWPTSPSHRPVVRATRSSTRRASTVAEHAMSARRTRALDQAARRRSTAGWGAEVHGPRPSRRASCTARERIEAVRSRTRAVRHLRGRHLRQLGRSSSARWPQSRRRRRHGLRAHRRGAGRWSSPTTTPSPPAPGGRRRRRRSSAPRRWRSGCACRSIYLVDCSGLFLPEQSRSFPGRTGAGHIFKKNSGAQRARRAADRRRLRRLHRGRRLHADHLRPRRS